MSFCEPYELQGTTTSVSPTQTGPKGPTSNALPYTASELVNTTKGRVCAPYRMPSLTVNTAP